MDRRDWLAAQAEIWIAATADVRAFARTLHGLDESTASAAADEAGYVVRVTMIDGVGQRCTLDRRGRRINARLVDGVVVETTIG